MIRPRLIQQLSWVQDKGITGIHVGMSANQFVTLYWYSKLDWLGGMFILFHMVFPNHSNTIHYTLCTEGTFLVGYVYLTCIM